jgi:cytochrome c553
MHINWRHLAIVLAVLPFIVLFVAWIGFFNVGASSGHWKATEWFLHFAMRSAVRTYALQVEVPSELPRHAIQTAAGHFARGCAICHGAPGEPRSPAALRMLPQPPVLAQKIGEWNNAELFRIVKHGIRFTGMPAWPTQARDDEVWAMVAFLRALPTLEVQVYRQLAYGAGGAPSLRALTIEQAVAECARCHGKDGGGRSATIPVLAGQSEAYLLDSLHAFAEERRPSGIMALASNAVDKQHFPELARRYAAMKSVGPPRPAPDPSLLEHALSIATKGIVAANVPACFGCHERPDRNPQYPYIAGQPSDYIKSQLELFRTGTRGGSRYSHLMAKVAKGLSDHDIAALANYFATLPASTATARR